MDNHFLHIEYTQADIERYLQGKMTNAEMHAIEKAALQDPFLADAIEGYKITNFDKAKEEILIASEAVMASANSITEKNYSQQDFEKYFSGSMSSTEMYLLEKNSHNSQFLGDAFEGYENTNMSKAKEYLAETEKKILGEEKKDAKVVSLAANSSKQWLKIAAAVLLMIGVGSTVWYINNKNELSEKNIAQINHEEIKQAPSNPSNNFNTNSEPTVALPKDKKENSIIAQNNNGQSNIVIPPVSKDVTTYPSIVTEDVATAKDAAEKKIEVDDAAKMLDGKISGVNVTPSNKEATINKSIVSSNNSPRNINVSDKVVIQNRGYSNNNSNNNQAANVLKGRVVNENGEPVFATLSVITDNKFKQNLTTNSQGDFAVAVPDTTVIVNLNSVGYANLTTTLSTNSSNNVVLQKSNKELDEVVVVGYNRVQKKEISASATSKVESKELTKGATPVGGWQAFYDYVNKKKNEEMAALDSATTNEDVTVEFKVDEEGKPYSISTSRNNNSKITSKAKEIIEEGPKWINAKKGKRVKVILKF